MEKAVSKAMIKSEANKRKITIGAEKALDELENEFASFYFKDSFEKVICRLYEAKSPANFDSALDDLYDMLDNCDIKYEKYANSYPYGNWIEYIEQIIEKSDLMTPANFQDKVMLALYSLYQRYAKPESFIERVVNDLEDKADDGTPVWKDNSLRLRILKQCIKYGDYLKGAGYKSEGIINYVMDKAPEELKAVVEEKLKDELIRKVLNSKRKSKKETEETAKKRQSKSN